MISLYILGAILLLLLVGVILAPLLEREPPDRDLEDLPPEERYEATLEALRELEFEYQTEKLSDEEYGRLRAHYGRLALGAEEEMERDVEGAGEEIAAAASSGAREPASATGGGEGATPAGAAAAEDRGTCDACGGSVPAGARFCPRCGEEQGEG